MDWFGKVTGLASDRGEVVRAGITVDGPDLVLPDGRRLRAGVLTTPSLSALMADLPDAPGRLRLTEVVASVTDLHADPGNAGAVFQVASQANLLEMIGPDVTPEQGIARYAHDLTQGPACAMACAAGTIFRNYLVPLPGGMGQTANRQIDTMADLGAALGNAGGALWQMRNGYLMPRPGALPRIAAAVQAADRAALMGLLQVGVQADTAVTLPGAGHLVTQVYASALPIAYAGGALKDWEPLARLVLEAAYLATLAVALRGSRRVFLTRLGGGAFGNPGGWISDAIAAALTRFAHADLQVTLVSYRRPDPENARLLARFAANPP